MNTNWKNLHIILFAGFTLHFAEAAPVTVPNFSFEDPDYADGLFTINMVPNWTVLNPSDQPNLVGAQIDPQDVEYAGSTGNNAALPGTAHGGQMGLLKLEVTPNPRSASLVSAAALATVADNTRYTLTVAVGRRAIPNRQPYDATIELLVNNVVAATLTTNGSSLAQGTFTDFSTSFATSPGDPRTGGSLTVRLTHSKPIDVYNVFVCDFDNVRVEATALPPPASLGINVYAGIEITGSVGVNYRIDFATTVSPPNWMTLTNIVLPESPYFFVDKTSAGVPGNRIYRAVAE